MNDLTVYERIADPLAAVKSLGLAIARSRIFGCESEAQGEVLAWECLARKVPPLALKESYHLINTAGGTSLTMRADAMLAGFNRIGGRHRIIQRDGERAEIELTYGGQTVLFHCTYEEAQKAGLTEGKKGEKDNWSSPRQRMQMLWARVVSDGVRAMAPQVCAGRYTPEDFGVVDQDEATDATAGTQEGAVAGTATDGGRVVDAEFVVQPVATAVAKEQVHSATGEAVATDRTGTEPARTEPSKSQPTGTTAPTTTECTAAQRGAVQVLFDELGLTTEQRATVLQKRGVNSIRSLSPEQAAILIENLQKKANQVGSKPKPAEMSQPVTGPASAEQVAEIKGTLLPELAQVDKPLYDRLVAKMKADGRKFANMNFEQARSLIEQIKLRNLDGFFAQSLAGKPA